MGAQHALLRNFEKNPALARVVMGSGPGLWRTACSSGLWSGVKGLIETFVLVNLVLEQVGL